MAINLRYLIGKLKDVLEKYDNILFAILFGSYARNMATSNSDIDIAILFKEKPNFDELSNLILDIASNLRVREDKVDILVLGDDVPYELRFKVFRDGIPILIRDLDSFRRYRDKSISLYLDFRIFIKKLGLKEKYIKYLKEMFYGRSYK